MTEQFDFSEHRLPPLRGFAGIGMEDPKYPENIGSVIRSAKCYGADFVFSTAQAPSSRQAVGHQNHMPVFNNANIPTVTPENAEVVAVEYTDNSTALREFTHPERAVYVLGRENTGVSDATLEQSDRVVHFSSAWCENVATSGAIVLQDRLRKQLQQTEKHEVEL